MPQHSSGDVPIYELRIALKGSKPPIWRRVAAPRDLTLAELHEVVQIAMGWLDCHLHQFRTRGGNPRLSRAERVRLYEAGPFAEAARRMRGERVFSLPDPLGWLGEDDGSEDSRGVTLGEVCPQVRSKLTYEYDFGDSWEHAIEVQKVYPPRAGVRYPICLAGKLACPPEDCGGIWGYYGMLAALGDPAHPEHADMVQWIGTDFDPARFDHEQVNAIFATWRRPPRLRAPRADAKKTRRSRASRTPKLQRPDRA